MNRRTVVTRQLVAFFTALCGIPFTVLALVTGHWMWALLLAAATVAAGAGARLWSRADPGPMPFFMRWILRAPRPYQSASQLCALLAPGRGERLLEIGPGIGTHAIPIARSIAPDGRLDVVDIQQDMLDALVQRARDAGIANIAPCRADAGRLPYADGTFDAAYLISVLGEIPGQGAALQELRRVLRADARLVIGEMFIDPDFIGLGELRQQLALAGFRLERRVGVGLAYLAQFRRIAKPNGDDVT